ncbi:MAG: hypothetical protein KDC92_12965 [Bacteroidetes bacterium]|nr:hypothetical protein [Bacteroidota bacterium]
MKKAILLITTTAFILAGCRVKSYNDQVHTEKAPDAPPVETIDKKVPAPKPVPQILGLFVSLEAENGVEKVALDSNYLVKGTLEETKAKVNSEEHRLRFTFTNEDQSKKMYKWQRHPLFMTLKLPNGEIEKINSGKIDLFVTQQYEPWMTKVIIESFPAKSAGKVLGEFELKL